MDSTDDVYDSARRMTAREEAAVITRLAAARALDARDHPAVCRCPACKVRQLGAVRRIRLAKLAMQLAAVR